jgi:hypothetical protein
LISVFDLKGSLVDRKVKGKVKPSTTLKDQNFMACQDLHARSKHRSTQFINLKPIVAKRIVQIIRKDVAFLKSQNLMDYSLLICIEKVKAD